mmetsp:Transcript_3221/g.6756  ORF Transcript_3221/g.6756 Transcript_3221/m.6756 type:complete len:87 (-) Transcript_3221:280-540(-)|eukprot:CAMPEP_0119478456 /NCGR_PEP_ID=MMETSP1344-20130328/8187_1 /TAXON_ID=236787 /ORGANISM="Florenciella parvula, Strain CCMP2471" /LENGTH=86 /DNA_ID=CAMNT_0007512629 /DNA_START=33 /DNA_END=293 /DNA_ORIENTATION=+
MASAAVMKVHEPKPAAPDNLHESWAKMMAKWGESSKRASDSGEESPSKRRSVSPRSADPFCVNSHANAWAQMMAKWETKKTQGEKQ